jgi:hypothetical protein
MRAGYHRVSVVRGGFEGLMNAGVSMGPKAVAVGKMPSSGEDAAGKA